MPLESTSASDPELDAETPFEPPFDLPRMSDRQMDVDDLPPPLPSHGHRVTVEEVPDEDEGGIPRKLWIEDFPLPAGSPLGKGETHFDAFRSKIKASEAHPWTPFESKEEWELARWLMTSGMTQKAIDEYLKLKIISRPSHAVGRI